MRLGLIGCGRRGNELLALLLQRKDVAIPIVCDVDRLRVERAADRVERAGQPKPEVIEDYARMMERTDVDGVVIASPDHWHVIQLLHACLAGKDAYLETPISHNVTEGLMMIRAVRTARRVVQVGLQHRAGDTFNDAADVVASGELGRVAQTRSWTFARAKPIAHRPDGSPPESLAYDRWLGPAPERPFNPGRVPEYFDNWWDYGGGMITRFNVHLQDVIHRAMKVNVPKRVTVVASNDGLKDFRETPDTMEAVFEYETKHRPVAGRFMHVYSLRMNNDHAAYAPPVPRPNGTTHRGEPMHWGTSFSGDGATLFVDRDRAVVHPAGKDDADYATAPSATAVRPTGDPLTAAHLADFVACVRSRAEPRASIEAGHFAVLPCHLANIAWRTSKPICYDAGRNQCFVDLTHALPFDEATELLTRTYREAYLPPQG